MGSGRSFAKGLRAIGLAGEDPRLLRGAYVTDGIDLYEIMGTQRGPGVMGVSTVRVILENCRNLRRLEFLPEKIRRSFSLVRQAPSGRCPDLVEDIVW
ncbi:MAG: hypothetical protein JOZ98_14465 [Solirubrobacterales bacterium]|nr:hypothetical protein [Solirubrobacterales bacterium]MBV9799924.1 hypothetical protein [Solirubrobacterales bacterium]